MPEEVFETPQTTAPESFEWPKIILTALLGLSLLAGAAYAGYWYGTESTKVKSQISKTQPKSQIQQTPTPTPTLTVEDETAGWETYRNEEYRFEFKYPERYKLRGMLVEEQFKDKYKVPGEDSLLDLPAVEVVKKIYKLPAQEPRIELYLVSTTETVESYIQKRQQKLEKEWIEFVSGLPIYADSPKLGVLSINDYQGRFIEAKRTDERGYPNAPNQNFIRFYFKNNGILFILSGRYGAYASDTTGERGLDEKEVVINLFNTFKFLD